MNRRRLVGEIMLYDRKLACMDCESIMDLAIGFISRLSISRLYCCVVEVLKSPNDLIFSVPSAYGKNGNRGIHEMREMTEHDQ